MAHVDILVLDFLVNEVSVPDSYAIVVDSKELRVRFVIEGNLVSSVSANWVTTKSLASYNLCMNIRNLNNFNN